MITHFLKAFLSEIQELFVCILLLGRAAGILKLAMGVQISTPSLHRHRNAWRVSAGTGGGFAIRAFRSGRDPFGDRDDMDPLEVRPAV